MVIRVNKEYFKMNSLENKIIKLLHIDEEIKTAITNGNFLQEKSNIQSFFNKIFEFCEIRLNIKKEIAENPTVIFNDFSLKQVVIKISDQKEFTADMVLKTFDKNSDECIEMTSLNENEINDLSSKILFNWFGPREYIEGLIEIGLLITNVDIPINLKRYVDEARKCYAFQQYNAVNALSRIILEYAMRDIAIRKNYITVIENPLEFYKKYPPKILINKVSKNELKSKVESLYYDELSPQIHGLRNTIDRDIKIELKDTIIIVEELYRKNNLEV